MMTYIYDELKRRLLEKLEGQSILNEKVRVKARALTPEEAIGNPEADDFPLQKGKERLMHADFRGAFGQAFTDRYGDFEGSLNDILQMPLKNNYRRGIFVATLNAVLRYLGKVNSTIHCKDKEPTLCASELAKFIKRKFGAVKVVQVGFQPRMVESLAGQFSLRVLDLDPDNIGREKFGVLIEGPEATERAIQWADLLLITGTTLVNNTIGQFSDRKPVIFYGTTIAGAAYLMGWPRFCAYGN